MSVKDLRVSFDYIYPDEPAIVVCETLCNGGIRIKQVYTGEKALQLHSQLTGESIDTIRREAGYPTERMDDNNG